LAWWPLSALDQLTTRLVAELVVMPTPLRLLDIAAWMDASVRRR